MLPLPLPWQDLPLQMLEHEWGEQLLLVASFQLGAPSAPLPSSQPFTQTWDFGQLAAGALSSVSLPGKMDFLQNLASHLL